MTMQLKPMSLKQKIRHFICKVTGIHRIHHIRYAFGYTFPFSKRWVYFPAWTTRGEPKRYPAALRSVNPRDYHDCTATEIY